MDLPFDDSGVDLPPAIVNDHVTQDFYFKSFGVDIHDRHMRRAREAQLDAHAFLLVRMLRQRIAVIVKRFEARLAVGLLIGQAPISAAGNLCDTHGFIRRAAHSDTTIAQFQVVDIGFELRRGAF